MEIEYIFIDEKDFSPFFIQHRKLLFADNFDFDISLALSDSEKEGIKQNQISLIGSKGLHLVAKDGDKIIGWCMGFQKSASDFYMANSAVFVDYRRKGIYTKMLKMSLAEISARGFQRIFSRHKMTNNIVLIPKLKLGFMITGFEVNDVFGTMVELSYYTNPIRREMIKVRTGERKLDDEMTKYIV